MDYYRGAEYDPNIIGAFLQSRMMVVEQTTAFKTS